MGTQSDTWVWLESDDYDADPPAGQVNSRGLANVATGRVLVDCAGCENAFLRIDEQTARLIAAAPELLAMLKVFHGTPCASRCDACALIKRIDG